MWDTWLFPDPQHPTSPFYLNYLSSCDASCDGPTGGSWNGVGAALSSDGVHFSDEGVQIHKDPAAVWLGSGSVLRLSNGTYVMNFSEEYDCKSDDTESKGGCQSIFFATTDDLIKGWQRVPFAPPPADDPNVFKYGAGYRVGGRWDCIATVPKPGSPGLFYGFWTATPDDGHGAGVGETTDATGIHWKALPPISAGLPNAEVGSTVVINGKYYMLYEGGHLYTSTDPISGYVLDAVNPEFHLDGMGVAFSRLWNVQSDHDTVLMTHQWIPSRGRAAIYLGPIKEAKIGGDGTLRVVYWKGNDALKGASIALNSSRVTKRRRAVVLGSCSNSFKQHWLIPAVGSTPVTLRHRGSPGGDMQCLGFDRNDAAIIVPCADPSVALVSRSSNGSIITRGRCLGATSNGELGLTDCAGGLARWIADGMMLQLDAGEPLNPSALWRFEDPGRLGRIV